MMGEFSFGFPSGQQEFEFILNGEIISTQTVNIIPHKTSQINIIIGNFGDLNEDGYLNVLDIIVLVNFILNDNYYEISDLNGDGWLNILDIIVLVNLILQ